MQDPIPARIEVAMHERCGSSVMTPAKETNGNIVTIDQHAAPSQEGRRTIAEIVADLTRPVAPRHVRTRKQGTAVLSYIEWHTCASYLDHFAPGWSWSIESITEHGGLTIIHGALSIPASDGVVTRHATGIEDTDNKGYGDAVSNASAMAFKRAAAMFGLGRHLYSKSQD